MRSRSFGRFALVLPGLRDRRKAGEGGVAEEGREPVADEPPADELVAVAVRAERRLRVVHVQDAEPIEPDARVEIGERVVERGRGRRRRRRTPTSGTSRGRRRAAGAGPAASESAASSAIERPIVPPAPAAFSMHSQRSSVVSSRSSRSAGSTSVDGVVEAETEVRADVEDDRLGADRVGRLHRRAERHERVLADGRVAAREVDEVERVARDAP